MDSARATWSQDSHESKVEKFYGTIITDFHDYHGGYLNFGLWEEGNTDYLKAAEHLVKTVGTMAGLTKDSYVLDVGCGMGAQDLLLHNTFGSTIQAIDLTAKHVQMTKKRIEAAQLGHAITATQASATRLPFPDATYTHVTSIEGNPHFNTREDFFREAHRVLKPGGILVLADYTLKRPAKNAWERFLITCARRLWKVPKANLYGKEAYEEKLRNAGFTNITTKEVGAKTIPGYVAEQSRKEVKEQLRKVRGWWATYPGHLINTTLLKLYTKGLVDYVLVRAEKQ